MALLALGAAGLCAFGFIQFFLFYFFRRSLISTQAEFARKMVPVAKINDDGKSSVVTGVVVRPGLSGHGMQRGGYANSEKQSLLGNRF
jgi:hypothetical protein